ncbi:MAG: hypothetical protein HUU20_04810 [Pirellulales bacterium]|nr:hypothetical protein [Pirellulales bacterium]
MTLKTRFLSAALCIAAIAPGGATALAREIHVAETGDDTSPGDQARPYRTISKRDACPRRLYRLSCPARDDSTGLVQQGPDGDRPLGPLEQNRRTLSQRKENR